MLDQLRTFKPFRTLTPRALGAVAQHADRLRLPEQRWLRRRGQPLTRELFLVHGTVAVRSANAVKRITAQDTGGESLNALAGDGAEISTATTVDVIAVDLDPIRPLLEATGSASPPEVTPLDGWMLALLEGPVMRWFPPCTWVRLLRAGEARKVRQGELILARGEVSECVFVVGEGIAASGTKRFCSGDFFAEESALRNLPAVADVIMAADGVVIAFPRRDILGLAGEYDAPTVDPPQRVDLDRVSSADEEAVLAGLVPKSSVALRGGEAGRRLVIAARLMREGFTVV